ncbi:MAG: class I SAM-dependent methyltransferase [Proteobacteria bacterium]|jgi:tellurite methyltransferase|nr:class I SAM-dependent methyltransferase [Pseudomonadota bacterium]
MQSNRSLEFFDRQFRRQVEARDFELNPFEQLVLPHLSGTMLDFGCGLGNLAIAAARSGCTVSALDASPTAIGHLRDAARREALPVSAQLADLSTYRIAARFDSAASIGLLMFFDCSTARRQLDEIKGCVRPGGVAAVNVLIEGTDYMDMFDPAGYCLFSPAEILASFEGWQLLADARHVFPAPGDTTKSFMTIVARKPAT